MGPVGPDTIKHDYDVVAKADEVAGGSSSQKIQEPYTRMSRDDIILYWKINKDNALISQGLLN